jgi:hypothetical protein
LRKKATRKVAVLGTATTTLQFAPVNDPSWEIWACSPWMQGRVPPRSKDTPGFDRFFEIHWKNQFYPSEHETFLPWLRECGKPVYVFEDLGIPTQVMYPKKEMEALHGVAFFTSQIAWMLALAIEERPARIGIWGVDMEEEYSEQKQGCLHFMALARLLGIDIELPSDSLLAKVPLPYPDRYATKEAMTLLKKREQIEAQLKDIQSNIALYKDAESYSRGQLELVKSLEQILV